MILHIPQHYSKIFKTFNSNIDKSTSKIGMFNKSFLAMSEDLKNGYGLGFSIFGGQGITSEDKQAILDYNDAVKSGLNPGMAWANTMSNCSNAAREQAQQCIEANGDLVELANGLEVTTLSAKATTLGLKALSMVGNMVAYALIAKGAEMLMNGISEMNDDYADLKNSISNLQTTYNEQTESLEEINSKLQENKERIEEILKLKNPTYADLKDLEDLRTQNALLKENAALYEKSKNATQQKITEQMDKKLDMEFFSNDAELEEKTRLDSTEDYLKNIVTFGGYNVHKSVKISNKDTQYEKVLSVIEDLEYYNNLKNEAIYNNGTVTDKSGKSWNQEELETKIKSYDDELQSYSTMLLSKLDERIQAGVSNESDYSKYLIALNDNITKFLDFDIYANGVIDKTTADNKYSDLSEKIKDSISKGIIKNEEDLLSDEEAKKLIKYISMTIYDGASNDESMKKAASYVMENFSDGLEISVDEIQTKSKNTILNSVEQIKKDLSSPFKELSSAYSEIFKINSNTGEIDFSLNKVDNDMLSGLKESFSELEGFDTANLEDFFEVLTNEKSTVDDVQKAFNHLAITYLYSSEVMDKLNDETAESVAKQLEAMGITNANTLINEVLSLKENWVAKAKEKNITTTRELQNATYEEISALKDENGQLDETEQKLYAFWMEKNAVNNIKIMTDADINNLMGLIVASGNTCSALSKLYKIKSTLAELDELYESGSINADTYQRAVSVNTKLLNGESIHDDFTKQTSNIKDLLTEAQKEVSSYYNDFFAEQNNVTFNGNINSQSNDSTDNSNDSLEKSLQTFDWIETKVNNLTEALNRLKETSDDTYTSWADRSTALANAINTTRQAIDLQQQAYNRYMQEAEKSGLSDIYKNLIQNGALDIAAIDDEDLKEKISDYQSWYDKAKNCLEVQEDLKNSLNELNSKKFDNIQSIFDFDISKTEHLITMLNSQTDKLEMKGLFATENYYNQMLQYTQSKINTLTNEKKQLADIMNSSTLSHDSEAWRNMYSTLSETDEQINDLNKDLIEFNNNIRDLNWEIFEYLEESINRITDETEYLIELISKKDLFDKENGNLTEYADAVLGLHAAAYDTYKQQAKDYYEEVSDLQKQLVNGAGKDVLEQYSDMLKSHQDAVLAAEDERKAILDLIEEGYNAQLESIQKIIDKKKEQMSAEKNLYDYQKTIKEKTDNISSLEKQQAAYAKDDSEETMSKIQQLKVQLEEAKADLKETEYEQYLSDTENMLDELSTDYEEWMNARLDNEDALLSEIIGTVADKGNEINATINDVAKEYGTTVSDSITSIFNSASPFTNILTNGFNSVSSSIAGTTSAIDRLIAQVAGITNANAGKTNAGSGTSGNRNVNYNSSSVNSAINTGSNKYSNGLNNSSSNSSTANDAEKIFIHKTDTYPKNKLNTETSIVDRLKYYNFDSSFSARASYYSKLGGSGTYRGSDSQNTWLIQKMKSMGYKNGTKNAKAGLHWTQENGEEIIVRKSDGAVLTHLNKGDLVLDNESSQILWEFSQNPGAFMKKFGLSNLTPQINITAPILPATVGTNASSPLNMNVGDIEINLPNVKNYDDFKNQLIKDGNFEKAMFSAINHAATGKGNVFDKMKYTR